MKILTSMSIFVLWTAYLYFTFVILLPCLIMALNSEDPHIYYDCVGWNGYCKNSTKIFVLQMEQFGFMMQNAPKRCGRNCKINGVGLDKTAPKVRSSLIWVYSICSGLPVPIVRILAEAIDLVAGLMRLTIHGGRVNKAYNRCLFTWLSGK